MEFAEAVELVRSLEEKALEYELPKVRAEAVRRIEFSPQEYSEMSYAEALAAYSRVEKVIAGSEMVQRIYGAAPEAEMPGPEVPVVPAKLEERPRVEAPPPAPGEELEMEARAPPVKEELEFEKPEEHAEPPLEMEAVPVEAPKPPREEPPQRTGAVPEVALRIPPVLMTSPGESAISEVEKLEKQFGSELKASGRLDKDDAKKRMLELTRELFREKSIDRREEIKKEIVALKTMLSEAEGKAKPKADISTVVKNDQEYEVSSAKKAVVDAYEGALAPLLRYYDDEAALGRGESALQVLEERAARLREQVADLIRSYEAFLVSKHSAELEELARRGKGTGEMEARKAGLASAYGAEFAALRNSVWSEIDSAVAKRRGGTEEASDEDLLSYLQAEEPVDYQRYARGEITRVQALAEARGKMASRKERK